jgi:hypothetical protein
VYFVEELKLLIVGYDYKIYYIDVSDVDNLEIISSETYEDEVSEPYDYRLS